MAQEMNEEPPRELLANGDVVFDLAETARADAAALKDAPKMVRKTLERGAWRKFADPYSKAVFEYGPDEFEKFTLAKRPAGLELPEGIKTLIGICELAKGDEDAAAALVILRGLEPKADTHAEAGAKGGRGKKAPDNIRGFSEYGTSDTYLLRRLKRDHADLAAKVVSGEMSAHAAGVEAGFVKLMVQHEPTVTGFARAAKKHLTDADRLQLAKHLEATG
jgi:hypothetical protein